MINSLDHTFIDYFIIDPTEKEVGQSMAILRTGYVFGHDGFFIYFGVECQINLRIFDRYRVIYSTPIQSNIKNLHTDIFNLCSQELLFFNQKCFQHLQSFQLQLYLYVEK